MLASDTPAYEVVAAVRTTGPSNSPFRQQFVKNGGFDDGLTSWESGTSIYGAQFAVIDGSAEVFLPLVSQEIPGQGNGIPGGRRLATRAAQEDTITLQQTFTGSTFENNPYYMSFDIAFKGAPLGVVNCQIIVTNGIGDVFFELPITANPGTTTMYGSGSILFGSTPRITFNIDCIGSSDVFVRLDNVLFNTFAVSYGTGTCNANRQVIQNPNFDDGLALWTTSPGVDNTASFSMFGHRVRASFSLARGSSDAPGKISQTVNLPANTPYTFYADLFFTIDSGTCAVSFGTDFENIYFTGQITSSQWLPVSERGVFGIDANAWVLSVDCYPGSGNRVELDNVYIYLDPGMDCPPPNTPPQPPIPSTTSEFTTSTESASSTTEEMRTSTESSTSTTEEASTSTDSTSSTSTDASTSTSSTATPSATATHECPEGDGTTYENTDGSRWMTVCNQDYASNDLTPVATDGLSACTDHCMALGTACVGVSWVPSRQISCYPKTKMEATQYPGITVHSTIRMSGPSTGPALHQMLRNGDFATSLDYWTTPRSANDQQFSFVWQGGKA